MGQVGLALSGQQVELYKVILLSWVKIATTVVVVFVVFYIVAGITFSIFKRIAERDSSRRDVLLMIGRAVRSAIIVMGVITALGSTGVDLTALVAGLGLTGFALGFALKDLVSSATAGFLILISRPFKSGDIVEVTGLKGEVLEIDLRYTTLQVDNDRLLIPNSTILTNTVKVFAKTA